MARLVAFNGKNAVAAYFGCASKGALRPYARERNNGAPWPQVIELAVLYWKSCLRGEKLIFFHGTLCAALLDDRYIHPLQW